jgi:hypothetical protein
VTDNLMISIGADSSKLRAELAVAQSEMRAFSREMNAAANVARKAGDDLSFAKVGQAAAQFEQVTAKVVQLKSAMAEAGKPAESLAQMLTQGFGRAGAAIREPLDALAMMRSGLRQTAEVAGIVFAVDKVVEWTKRMGELGERTIYMAAATGQTPHQFSLLTGALRLAGGEADRASRTIEILGKNVQEALTTKTSSAAKAAQSLGISQQELRKASTDTGYALDLLADKWVHFQDDLTKSTDFRALLGRGFEVLIPLLSRGSAGMEEFKAKAAETGIVLSDQETRALADTGEKVHELSLTLEGAGVRGFMALKGAIDTAIGGLSSFITMAHNALAAVTDIETAADHAERIRAAKGIGGRTTGATTGPSGYWGFRLGKMRFIPYPTPDEVPGDNLNFKLPPPSIAAPSDYGGGGDAAKPAVAPWPVKEPKGSHQGAAPITADFNLADSAAQAQIRIDASYLSAFKSNMEALKDAKTITVAQMLGFDIQYTAQLEAQDQARLRSAMAAADAIVVKTEADAAKKAAAQLKVWEQEMELSARAAASIAQDQKKIADDAAASAKKVLEAWSKPFETGFDKIGSAIEKGLTDALLHTGSKDWGKQLYQSMVGDLVGGAGSVLSKGVTKLLPSEDASGAKGPEGETLSAYFARQLAELVIHSSFLAGILGNTAATAAASAACAGTSAAGSIAGGGISAAGSIAGGGFLSGLGDLIGFGGAAGGSGSGIANALATLAFFPVAAKRGYDVPSFSGGGWSIPGGLSMLHPREMVLPEHLADRVRGMTEPGGSAGDIHLHQHFHGPADAPGIARFFKDNQHHIASALQRALRSNQLTPRTF